MVRNQVQKIGKIRAAFQKRLENIQKISIFQSLVKGLQISLKLKIQISVSCEANDLPSVAVGFGNFFKGVVGGLGGREVGFGYPIESILHASAVFVLACAALELFCDLEQAHKLIIYKFKSKKKIN